VISMKPLEAVVSAFDRVLDVKVERLLREAA
jgi:hypothetical protein